MQPTKITTLISEELRDAYIALWASLTSRYPVGTNVFERDWDALIILDTCRVDALKEVADEYSFLSDIDSIVSVGSTSREWVANTFRTTYTSEIRGTAYVSANAFSKRVLKDRNFPADRAPVNWKVADADDFLLVDDAWQYQPEHPYKHMLPEHLTDRAITVGRELQPDRLIVHYSQPHSPYIAMARREGRELKPWESNPFKCLRAGSVERETVWNAYLENLRMSLDSVSVLLENLNAERVAISADHGEGFGRWGTYKHPLGSLQPNVKRVPWATTTARDRGEYEPQFKPRVTGEQGDKDEFERKETVEHLRDLGYL